MLHLIFSYGKIFSRIAGGKNEGLLFKKGEIIRKVKQEDMVKVLKEEILKMIK